MPRPPRPHLAWLTLALAIAFFGAGCGGALNDPEGEAADPAFGATSCRGAPYPILLAHGMAGWDKIGGFWNYYHQIPDDLRSRGERIYLAQVSPFESSSVRGAPAGSPGLKEQLRQLSTAQMVGRFNPANPDDSRVAYYSVAGRSALRIADPECRGGLWANPQRSDVLDPILGPVQVVFSLTSRNPLSPAVNDGLVSVESARWGRFLGCVPADHLDEIGQILRPFPDPFSGFDHKQLYRRLAEQLHRDGF
jgi:hypothetical protein